MGSEICLRDSAIPVFYCQCTTLGQFGVRSVAENSSTRIRHDDALDRRSVGCFVQDILSAHECWVDKVYLGLDIFSIDDKWLSRMTVRDNDLRLLTIYSV